MKKPAPALRRLGNPREGLDRRNQQLRCYVTDAELGIVDALSGPGKPFSSASDLLRAGLALLVRASHPAHEKALRSDL